MSDAIYYRQKLNENDTKMFESIKKSSYKCKKCNKTVIITKQDRAICPDCGHWVYKTDKLEFKYNVLNGIKKQRRDRL